MLAKIKFGHWVPNCYCQNIIVDLNLAVCHAYCIFKYEILADFNLVVAKVVCQTTKFSGYIIFQNYIGCKKFH